MKKRLFAVLRVLLVLAISFVVAGVVVVDRYAWKPARRLSTAVRDARSVTLEEYVNDSVLAQRIATIDEISRLRAATSQWLRLEFPTSSLCYEPHHRIQIVRADGSDFDVDICFNCERFYISDEGHLYDLLPSLSKTLAAFFTSVGMTPKTDKEYSEVEASSRNAHAEETKNQSE